MGMADIYTLAKCWDLIVGKWCCQHSFHDAPSVDCCCCCCYFLLSTALYDENDDDYNDSNNNNSGDVDGADVHFAYLPNRFVLFFFQVFFFIFLDLHIRIFDVCLNTHILKAIKRGSLKGFKMMKKSLNSPVCSQHRANIIFIHTDCCEYLCVYVCIS